jgi:hypothetical protein
MEKAISLFLNADVYICRLDLTLKMNKISLLFSSLLIIIFACKPKDRTMKAMPTASDPTPTGERHFRGAFSNGMKGDSIFFTVSADNKTLRDLTFKGYWRCSGTLERTLTGPKKELMTFMTAK